MHGDAPDRAADWEPYLADLRRRGVFHGGSSIAAGTSHRRSGPPAPPPRSPASSASRSRPTSTPRPASPAPRSTRPAAPSSCASSRTTERIGCSGAARAAQLAELEGAHQRELGRLRGALGQEGELEAGAVGAHRGHGVVEGISQERPAVQRGNPGLAALVLVIGLELGVADLIFVALSDARHRFGGKLGGEALGRGVGVRLRLLAARLGGRGGIAGAALPCLLRWPAPAPPVDLPRDLLGSAADARRRAAHHGIRSAIRLGLERTAGHAELELHARHSTL